jgi:hypothetical protein
MPAARKSRKYGIVAASAAVHAVLATLLVLNAPRLRIPEMQSGPPEAIIPILIMPRTPPPAAQPGGEPTQIRLHRRVTRFSDDPPPVAPLVAPAEAKPAERATQAPGPRVLTLPTQEDALAANARNALRSKLGCDSASLSRVEREACMDRFADGSRDAPFVGLGIDRDKAAGLDAAAARRERDFKYQRGIKTPSPPTAGAGWDTYRGPPPPSEAMGKMVGSDNVAKKIPF